MNGSSPVSDFLDDCYGSWFTPQLTFPQLTEPRVAQALGIVAGVNFLEGLRLGGALGGMIQLVSGILGWLVLNGLLWLLLTIFQRAVSYPRLLTLTGFASLPWLILPPAQTLGGVVGQVVTVGVLVWFVALQTWAVAVASELAWWRIALLVPFTFVGALIALNWTVNSLLTTTGLS